MFFTPYWILMGLLAFIGLAAIIRGGFNFVDFQVTVMTIAVSFFLDMVLCKWFGYYHYVTADKLNAFYSLIFCVIGYPAIGLAFIKFMPADAVKKIIAYILWVVILTLSEIYYLKPYGVVGYVKWEILPHSPIVFAVCLLWYHGYYRLVERRYKQVNS